MTKILQKHAKYYVSLLIALSLGGVFLAFSSAENDMKMMVAMIMAFFYVVWGIIHHYLEHDVNAKIVIEYVLIGALGISIIFFLLR
ncbi:MAG: hypothetical protein HY430_00960 [Candidatus Levybacteria bacterium]|nr:hypothetical protein [Candidatus Levybacteria bacterium]